MYKSVLKVTLLFYPIVLNGRKCSPEKWQKRDSHKSGPFWQNPSHRVWPLGFGCSSKVYGGPPKQSTPRHETLVRLIGKICRVVLQCSILTYALACEVAWIQVDFMSQGFQKAQKLERAGKCKCMGGPRRPNGHKGGSFSNTP